ncbi:hypothetical protein Poli38472_002508 [Pythium oligandrum]|uniref:Uncharacterized protein n=1 Tax=Pythium oligandrum TaxID=41045 RepID=A0A8K1CJV6_PYTOL|nr:hypothetical protein Poli38472_002508 [Pythium oligandrum]|eukprot:TMW63567.1 hypothetical protein Poli38472_002508 [Pythium oligandrum]
MCINIPDTIFLSPCGQPSVWYVTSASKHLKTRHTAHVTPRSILSILSSKAREAALRYCAVVRQGFRVRELTEAQLEELCDEMDQARLEFPSEEGDLTGSQRSFESAPTAFCVQAYMERTYHVTFICIWKSDDVPSNTSPKSKPNGDLYLVKRGGSDEDEYDGNGGVEKIHLTRLSLHEDDANTHAALKELGFDVESAVAHLFHMKLWTTEMLTPAK